MGVDNEQSSDAETPEEAKPAAGKSETNADQVWLTEIAHMLTIIY